MRAVLAWVAMVLGAALVLMGLVVAVVLGPDSRLTTGPHSIETDGVAIVTKPGVVTWKGLQIDVLAEVPVNKPVFVGVGNSIDVESYTQRTQRIEVTSFRTPWKYRSHEVKGMASLPAAPTALDWWISGSAGLGGASMTVTLPDETASVAIVAVGATNLSGLKLSFAYGIKGGFWLAIGVLLIGAGIAWLGWQSRFAADLPDGWTDDELEGMTLDLTADSPEADPGADPDADEGEGAPTTTEEVEVVFVYVDDDGVEHEITEEQARLLERAGHIEIVDEEEQT